MGDTSRRKANSVTEAASSPAMSLRRFTPSTLLGLVVTIPTIGGLTYLLITSNQPLPPELIWWTLLVAAIEYMPVPAWSGVTVSLGYPLLIAVAFTFQPEAAALVAFLGASDPREVRHEVTILRALFNRCEVTLAVLAASTVFHALSNMEEPLSHTIPAALVATVADYAISLGLVTAAVSIVYRVRPFTAFRELLGRGQEFLISYVGLGILGTVLAKLYSLPGVGLWSVVTVIAPLLFARQMFFRSQALEEAHTELKEREQILKQLSNAIAEERHDEREQIANYLHDDLAQVLFRLSIQVDVARKQLEKGEVTEVEDSLEKIRDAKQDTSDRIRALIRDLHRSPLGAKGLAEAIQSFTDEMGRDSGVAFHTDVADVRLPAPIALLVYHIAREGVMNALKHAHATDMWISVSEDVESIEFELRDNGRGFDTTAPGPEGHYGMAMMRGRATVAGGTFEVTSVPSEGTTITARFPISLLQQEDGAPDTHGEGGGAPGAGASPGTSGTTSQGDERSPEPVPTSS
jgi:signal transduction histidine kinase